MADVKCNRVTWNSDGVRVDLGLSGGFKLAAGMRPDVNRAVVRFDAFQAMLPNIANAGTVEFWYTNEPGKGQPDHVLKGMRIVDVQPGETVYVKGENAPRIVDFTVYIADLREGLVAPRGGRVSNGLLNPDEAIDAKNKDEDAIIENQQLAQFCLDATWLRYDGPPDAVNKIPPLRNLKWFGNHAPTELERVLEYCYCVLCPRSDGSVSVELIGEGTVPDVPADRKLLDASIPVGDRRGKTIIFSSEPNATLDTLTVSGMGEGKWRFVVQDVDGKWKPIEGEGAASILNGKDGRRIVRRKFADIDEKYRQQVRTQLYHCIQLDPTKYDVNLQPLLRRVLSQGLQHDMAIDARIATVDATGIWQNSKDPIRLAATTLGKGNILSIGLRLGRIEKFADVDPDASFEPLGEDDISAKITIEATRNTSDGPRPEYCYVGYRQELTGIKRIPDTEVENILDAGGRDVVIVKVPELRLLRENGNEVNRGAVEKAALALANRHLAGASEPYRLIRVKGYFKAELSGRVAEIEWDPERLTTTLKINTWWLPLGLLRDRAEKREAKNGTMPHQGREAAPRTAMGQAAFTQPVAALAPAPPAVPAGAFFCVRVAKFGGLAGSKTAKASFTYTASDLAGNELDKELPQLKPRPFGKMNEGKTFGLAFRDRDGRLNLWDAGETPFTGGC